LILDATTIDLLNIAAWRRKLGLAGGGACPATTDGLPEGLLNEYFTNARFDTAYAAKQLHVVAAEPIPAFSVVTSKGKIADSANPSQSLGKVIGIAPVAIGNGFSGLVTESGDVTNPAWTWTVGDLVFLNGTSLSTSAPATGFSQAIGTARAPTILVVDLWTPVLL